MEDKTLARSGLLQNKDKQLPITACHARKNLDRLLFVPFFPSDNAQNTYSHETTQNRQITTMLSPVPRRACTTGQVSLAKVATARMFESIAPRANYMKIDESEWPSQTVAVAFKISDYLSF